MQQNITKIGTSKNMLNKQPNKYTKPTHSIPQKKNPILPIDKSSTRLSLKPTKQKKINNQIKFSKTHAKNLHSFGKSNSYTETKYISQQNKRLTSQHTCVPTINIKIIDKCTEEVQKFQEDNPEKITERQYKKINISQQFELQEGSRQQFKQLYNQQKSITIQEHQQSYISKGKKIGLNENGHSNMKTIDNQDTKDKIQIVKRQKVEIISQDKFYEEYKFEQKPKIQIKIEGEAQNQQLLLNGLQQNYQQGCLKRSKTLQQLPTQNIPKQYNCSTQDIIRAIKQIKYCECHRHETNKNVNGNKSISYSGGGNKRRKLQIVCLDCQVIVCDYCVIFGDKDKKMHKLHRVISIDQFIKDVQQLDQFSKTTLPQKPTKIINANQITHPKLLQSLRTLKYQIHTKFTNIHTILTQHQNQLYTKLSQQYLKIQTKIQQQQYIAYKTKQQMKQYINKVLQNCQYLMCFQQLFGKQSYIYRERLNQRQEYKVNRINRMIGKIYYNNNNNKLSAIQMIHNLQNTNNNNKIIQKYVQLTDNIIVDYNQDIQHNINNYAEIKINLSQILQFSQQQSLIYKHVNIMNFKQNMQFSQQFVKGLYKNKEKVRAIIGFNQNIDNQFIFDTNRYEVEKTQTQRSLVNHTLQQSKMKGKIKQQTINKQKQRENKSALMKFKSLGNLYQFTDQVVRNKEKLTIPEKKQQIPNSDKKQAPNLLTPTKIQMSFVSIQPSVMIQQTQGQQCPISATTINSAVSTSNTCQIQKIIQQFAQNTSNPKNRNKIIVLNLQNQSITDQNIKEIFVSLFQKINKKTLKYLKLSDNKITDQGFKNLIKYLNSTSNVNMSGNMLSQNILDMLVKNKDKLATLRILNVKGNKIINTKAVKDKIGVLSKMGIMVQM